MSGYGHAYLRSYGWAGSGSGLRDGAIDKPLAIPHKKNLAGLGKDRDDAFPFWDHLFAAAAKAITINVSRDDAEDSCATPLARTTTGILSNRPPVVGTPASTSGRTSPGCLSLVATAKREAARRGLYARFFRGPVLGPDEPLRPPSPQSSEAASEPSGNDQGTKNKRKSQDRTGTKDERRERKRLKRAAKKAAKALKQEKAKKKKDRVERRAQRQRDNETRSNDKTPSRPKKATRRSPEDPLGTRDSTGKNG